MVAMSIKLVGEARVDAVFKQLRVLVKDHAHKLWMQVGPELRDDIINRIETQDAGRWAPASKWVLAKKNTSKALQGEGIRMQWNGMGPKMKVFSRAKYQMDDHHQGFTVPPSGQRVTIQLKNPSALGLPANAKAFSFLSKRGSDVPARKIWPTEAEVIGIVHPKVEPWIRGLLMKIPGVRVV